MGGTPGFLSQTTSLRFGDLGVLGVRVFFVISGYLISTLLFDEERRNGRISISLFYLRRTLRIFPAAYAFLLLITIASKVDWVTVRTSDLLHAVSYTMNFSGGRSWIFGHLWSLSTEEQFYLIWPTVVFWGGRRGAVRTAASVIAFAPILRLALWTLWPETRTTISNALMGTDAIATGCLLAALRDRLEAHGAYRRILSSRWLPLVAVFIVAVNAMEGGSRLAFAVGFPVLNVSIALLIHHTIRYPQYAFGRVLNTPFFAAVGVLSYSLYLWQQVFLNRNGVLWINHFPQNLVCAVLAACLSYYIVEKPFLALRRRLEKRQKARAQAAADAGGQAVAPSHG
jgi:peptidoglycan/LPS O-acetylase OafA/YrhL